MSKDALNVFSFVAVTMLCTVVGQILAKGREGKRTYRVVRLICLVVITKTQLLMLLKKTEICKHNNRNIISTNVQSQTYK